MKEIIFSQIPIEDLRKIIKESLREEMQEMANSNPKPGIEFITRKETSKILGVSLPTLNEWTKQGLIPAYRISSRVRYKKHEVLEGLLKVNTFKYKRGV